LLAHKFHGSFVKRYINRMRAKESVFSSFIFAFCILAAAASVGLYRTHRGAQIFSKPLFAKARPVQLGEVAAPEAARDAVLQIQPDEIIEASTAAFDADAALDQITVQLRDGTALARAQLADLCAMVDSEFALAPRERALKLLSAQTQIRLPVALENGAASLLASLQKKPGPLAQQLLRQLRAGMQARQTRLELDRSFANGAPTGKPLSEALKTLIQLNTADAGHPRTIALAAQIRTSVMAKVQELADAGRFREAFETLSALNILPGASGDQGRAQSVLLARQAQSEADTLRAFDASLAARDFNGARVHLEKLTQSVGSEQAQAQAQRVLDAEQYGGFHPGDQFSDLSIDQRLRGPEMAVIPVGTFVMGSQDNQPQRQANEGPVRQLQLMHGFAISRREISRAEFGQFVQEQNYQTEVELLGSSAVLDEKTGRISSNKSMQWRLDFSGQVAAPELPVIHVSYADANAFAAWLSLRTGRRYRLPTEAEFEYALRAGSQSAYWWGNQAPKKSIENLSGSDDVSEAGRHFEQAFSNYSDGFWGPAAIGSFSPNPFTLFDMAGNVSEWVQDCWHDTMTRAPADFSAWVNPGCEQRVIKGGSWGSAPGQTRSAVRRAVNARSGSPSVGFRVVRELI
jgi:formylglycine-generating enzyme required for sulfatase activity